jgi:hypothetical protein
MSVYMVEVKYQIDGVRYTGRHSDAEHNPKTAQQWERILTRAHGTGKKYEFRLYSVQKICKIGLS